MPPPFLFGLFRRNSFCALVSPVLYRFTRDTVFFHPPPSFHSVLLLRVCVIADPRGASKQTHSYNSSKKLLSGIRSLVWRGDTTAGSTHRCRDMCGACIIPPILVLRHPALSVFIFPPSYLPKFVLCYPRCLFVFWLFVKKGSSRGVPKAWDGGGNAQAAAIHGHPQSQASTRGDARGCSGKRTRLPGHMQTRRSLR